MVEELVEVLEEVDSHEKLRNITYVITGCLFCKYDALSLSRSQLHVHATILVSTYLFFFFFYENC